MIFSDNVSAFQAKTHLSELLRETERGRSFTIRRRNKTVAKLVPVQEKDARFKIRELAAAFRRIRKGVRGKISIRRLIEEGRRA